MHAAAFSRTSGQNMNTHILWNPEQGTCACCQRRVDHVRRFTSDRHNTVYCESCWRFYLEECNVEPEAWTWAVAQSWNDDVALELQCQGEPDGAAQEAAGWN